MYNLYLLKWLFDVAPWTIMGSSFLSSSLGFLHRWTDNFILRCQLIDRVWPEAKLALRTAQELYQYPCLHRHAVISSRTEDHWCRHVLFRTSVRFAHKVIGHVGRLVLLSLYLSSSAGSRLHECALRLPWSTIVRSWNPEWNDPSMRSYDLTDKFLYIPTTLDSSPLPRCCSSYTPILCLLEWIWWEILVCLTSWLPLVKRIKSLVPR